jgi:putative addiction module component (TIGR02574 family)
MSREELLRAALALPPDERVRLSVELLDSVEPVAGGLSPAWLAEIERRDAELAAGAADTVDADEVLAEYGLRLDP